MDFEQELEKAREEKAKALHYGKTSDAYYWGGVIDTVERLQEHLAGSPGKLPPKAEYPQAAEENEYRYIDAGWLEEVACGLTSGTVKYPGETWRTIPAAEHTARAIRHLNLYRMGDRQDNHLINASMRCMMAYCVDAVNANGEGKK